MTMTEEIFPNEHGVIILSRTCKVCGQVFTVCPAPTNLKDWEDCMSITCESYDPERDADYYFDSPRKGDNIFRE